MERLGGRPAANHGQPTPGSYRADGGLSLHQEPHGEDKERRERSRLDLRRVLQREPPTAGTTWWSPHHRRRPRRNRTGCERIRSRLLRRGRLDQPIVEVASHLGWDWPELWVDLGGSVAPRRFLGTVQGKPVDVMPTRSSVFVQGQGTNLPGLVTVPTSTHQAGLCRKRANSRARYERLRTRYEAGCGRRCPGSAFPAP